MIPSSEHDVRSSVSHGRVPAAVLVSAAGTWISTMVLLIVAIRVMVSGRDIFGAGVGAMLIIYASLVALVGWLAGCHSKAAEGLGSTGGADQGLGVLRNVGTDRRRQRVLHHREETVNDRRGIFHEGIGLHRGIRPLNDEVTGEHGPAQASDDTHGHMSTAPKASAVANWA